jgi:hypothetical protein
MQYTSVSFWADRGHGVDGLEARVAGFVHTLARDDTRGHHFHAAEFFGVYRALAVDRLARGRDHAAENGLADRHLGDAAGALDDVTLLDVDVLAHDGDTHVVLLQVQHEPEDLAGELHQLQGHDFFKPVDPGDPVAHGQDDTGFAQLDLFLVIRDLLFDDLAYFFSSKFH